MKNRCLLGAGVALVVALACAQAQAQWLGGPGAFYFGGEGGWTALPDQDFGFSGGEVSPTVSGKEIFNSGYNVGARAGYEWGPWRFEEEFRYQHTGISGFKGSPGLPESNGTTFGGSRNGYAIMTNVIYDFTFGWPITPHIGAGIGAVDVREGLHNSLIGTVVSDDSWQFGYQAIAGVRYAVTPFLALDVDYRYLATTDPSFKVTNAAAVYLLGNSFKSHYSSHNIVASLSLLFGAPPPPPPAVAPVAAPAPPPPPPREYLVFFDWDRYNITPAGEEIIKSAAAAWKSGAPVKIRVNGYTDLSGSAGYNVRLSIRRANAVANALARLGVPRGEMIVRGLGESNPRVPTAKGVREPQNRRVEIVFE
jgi:OmpA-OmpF porin, OOP family